MSGPVTWITGASAGIGEALALELARRGHTVAASARSEGKLAELAARASGPGRIVPVPADITNAGSIAAAVVRIEAELGPIDIAVLNAGTHAPVDANDFTAEGLRALTEINLFGTAGCLERVMPAMIARRRGRIAVVASVAGYRGLPTAAYYAAGKAALIAMTEALRFDLQAAGVTLQLVNPGFVRTPLTDKNPFPMPFLIGADVAARRIANGLEGSAFEITFPRRFTWQLKVLRILPYRLYFPLVARFVRR